jgi:hypothetical protein
MVGEDYQKGRAIAHQSMVFLMRQPAKAKTPKKRVARDRFPKQRGTILKTDKNMHRGGMKWNYWRLSAIYGVGR